jgi:hypothetical protein
MALAQLSKNTLAWLCRHLKTSIANGNNWVVQDQESKFICVGSTMTTLTKVWMLFFVNTMSIPQQKELNMVEGSACSYSCPMWRPASHGMQTKVSQTTLWIPLCSLPWAQCKRWIDRWDVCTCTRGYLQLKDGVQ